jgi:hypothetical protein
VIGGRHLWRGFLPLTGAFEAALERDDEFGISSLKAFVRAGTHARVGSSTIGSHSSTQTLVSDSLHEIHERKRPCCAAFLPV